MKLFRLMMGSIEKFGVAKDAEEMFEKRAEIEPAFEYTPVQIEEVQLDGYEISVKAKRDEPPEKSKTTRKK
jgi:hypothetical protein